MDAMAGIADNFVSAEIELLKTKAFNAARRLETPGEDPMRILEEQYEIGEAFLSLTVFDKGGAALSWGPSPAPEGLWGTEYLRRAFAGDDLITTSLYDPDGALVFYVCVPVGADRVLAAAVHGLFFSDLLSNFVIGKSGQIFLVDHEGTVLADTRKDRVLRRYNLIARAGADPAYKPAAELAGRMIRAEAGTGRYRIDGAMRVCAYRPVSGSRGGWALGIAAPLDESLPYGFRAGVLVTGGLCLLLGAAAAASIFIVRPYKKLAEFKVLAENSSRTKSGFLANISRGMRTPLNTIIGLSELTLGRGNLEEDAFVNLEKVHDSGVTLLGIINDIMDMTKIESGGFELVPAPYDLASLINDTVNLNLMRIGAKPVSFHLKVDETLPGRLAGDELRVKQIFSNLLSNAFKYTKQGSVEWSLTGMQDGRDVWLVSTVKDSGAGIRAEDRERLFSGYGWADMEKSPKTGGSGVGLALTKKMVEMMGGDITVESVYGLGSIFTVRIRQGSVDAAALGAEVAASLRNFRYVERRRERAAKLARAHIPYAKALVVDDTITNLDIARGMLLPYGMRVDCVTSGPAAIDLIRKAEVRYNAVFMDYMMPGMDGIEAVRLIREEIGSDYARTVPIIALTANAMPGSEKMFLQNGFQAFLPKPIDILRLDSIINRWVRDKEQEAAPPRAEPPPDKAPEQTSAERFFLVDKEIEGFDFQQGLKLFSGDQKFYREIVESWMRNTPPLLEKIRGCTQETLDDYRILLHGIKSSSYAIGAQAIGEGAQALEKAAKTGNLFFINEYAEDFVCAVRKLIDELSAVLRGH
jgi:signal transduction histidine kinase/DNA-binding NarL/FixJ family response regulator/HPt (histidine-containing phosphotransfer) domain-containing protein